MAIKPNGDYSIFKTSYLKDKYDKIKHGATKLDILTFFGLLVATLTTTVSDYSSFLPSIFIPPVRYIFITLSLVSFCMLIRAIAFVYFVEDINKNFESFIKDNGLNDEKMDLFIFKTIHNNSEKLLAIRKEDAWKSFFLPYTSECDNHEKHIKNIFNLNYDDFELTPVPKMDVNGDIAIHHKDECMSRFFFNFYHILIKRISFDQFNRNNLGPNSPYIWIEKKMFINDCKTAQNNPIVVKLLADSTEYDKLPYTFSDVTDIPKELLDIRKVIWNISNSCSYDCTICATHNRSKDKLGYYEKLAILVEIMQLKNAIIDFSGGDPLCEEDSIKVIKSAINNLGSQKVSITTTGQSTNNIPLRELDELNCAYDITYDFPGPSTCRGDDYNISNADAAKKLVQQRRIVNLHIPVLPELTENSSALESLVKSINDIAPHKVSLLRLMPVGKMSIQNYPPQYNPYTAIDYIKQHINKSIKIKLHCAFCIHHDYKNMNHCGMLNEKIGIDHLGNVFCCAWAGYLGIPKEENPFYMGNLLENTIKEILTSEKNKTLRDKINKCDKLFCKIFSFCRNGTVDGLYHNHDSI